MEQEKVWDEIAGLWNEYKQKPFGVEGDLVEGFIEKGDRVLDLGCGSGRNFFKFGGELYGVDFSSEMLKYARANADAFGIDVKLFKSNFWELDFSEGFFDKVVFVASFHCVEGKEKRIESLKEIYRVLRSGGKLLLTVWNKNSDRWKNKPKEKMVSWEVGDKKVMRYYYLYDYGELVSELEGVGFRVLDRRGGDGSRNIVLVCGKLT